MRKTKIICTMGPATDNEEVLRTLIENGMNVARLNFSHGTHEEQGKRMETIKRLRKELNKPVAIMLDTKGPEIRVRDFEGGKVMLEADSLFTLTNKEMLGTPEKASITYKDLYKDVEKGTHILIDDGLVDMIVEKIDGEDIVCRVINGGQVSNHKGVNVPGSHVNMPFLSKVDIEDVCFGISQEVDFVAASFVRSAADVNEMRKLLKDNGGENIRIISKIENAEGLTNIDEIIEASDAIMVARGDMGVELPEEEVPIAQKIIIKKVYEAGKQVITATQMLDSMIKNPRPTRAETADVANAIYDGTSAIMLSGETAAGKYPVESFLMMAKIAERTEQDIDYKKRFFHRDANNNPDITDAICHATCTTAYDLNSKAIIVVTKSGRSAKMISRYRPACDIIGCATSEQVCRQLNMSWGITPVLLDEKNDVFELYDYAIRESQKQKLVDVGDILVFTSGVPIGESGTTNMIKVEVVE
ncbi:MAG: pyruvate kinase [Butyrivibrio sp.]|nr:pyruvate kinase [Butyrivibrio sp.]